MLIFVRSISLHTTTVERILFFDFFTIFCEPFLKLEGDSEGGNPPATAGFWPFFLPRQMWQANFDFFLVPVRGINRDQRGTLWSRFVPRTGIKGGRLFRSRFMPRTGTKSPKRPGIDGFSGWTGTDAYHWSRIASWTGMDGFWGWIKDPFSTSGTPEHKSYTNA